MDIEFVSEQPAPADEPEDVLSVGRPRRLPRAVTSAVLALLVAAGGIGWLTTRSGDAPAQHPSASAATKAPVTAHIPEDVLAGCPNTLACDATHQIQQRQIDMIKRAMRQHQLAIARSKAHPNWTGAVTAGGTMVR